MAVEIKEFVIRVGIDYPNPSTLSKEGSEHSSFSPESKEEIVKECVKQVMKIIKQQQKR